MVDDENKPTGSLEDKVLVAECQIQVDTFKRWQDVAWQGINKYYLHKAQRQEMPENDLKAFKDVINKLSLCVQPIMKPTKEK